MHLTARDLVLDLTRPQVMGILNVTPDSFSDGGHHNNLDKALQHAERMLSAGATLIDIGGESTRPGATEVSEQEELDRVVPVVEALAKRFDVWLSVDTSKAAVITESARAGAHLINDIRSLQEPGALEAAAKTGLPVCLMHMQGQPQSMQQSPHYDDLMADVNQFLSTILTAVLRRVSQKVNCYSTQASVSVKIWRIIISYWHAWPNFTILSCHFWWGCHENQWSVSY